MTMFSTLHTTFLKLLAEAHEDGVDAEVLASAIDSGLEKIRAKVSAQLLRALKRNAPAMLKERRAANAGFERRNFKRWRRAFDRFEMLIEMATELGQEHDKEVRPAAIRDQDFRFDAIAHLQPKAILAAREMLCLLRGGYPDAAMARWRTLFEYSVTAVFLKENDQNIALRYLASFDFRALRAAREHNQYAERAGLAPFSPTEIAALERRAEAVAKEIGGALKKDYDWAYPGLATKFPTLKPDRVDFVHLQEAVELDHWRPYFRWANQHIHAGHRPFNSLLATCESSEPVALVGPSNSGFVDPFSCGALSLVNVTAVFLMTSFNVDRAIMADVLYAIVDEIGPLALQLEEKTFRAAQKRGHADRHPRPSQ